MSLATLLLSLQSSAATFDPTIAYGSLAILCDPDRFRMSVRASAGPASVDRVYPRRTVIAPGTLLAMQASYDGSPRFRRPLVRYEACGPILLKLEGAAYNLDVEGQSGAYDSFVAMTMLVDGFGAFIEQPDRDAGGLRMVDCDRALPRAAPCPDGYAVRLDIAYDAAARQLRLSESAASHVEDDNRERQTRERATTYDVDLSRWRGR